MAFIGILGARKFKDQKAVEDLVASLSGSSIIVTSGCTGVCQWTQTKARQRDLEVLLYAPDLSNIRSNFDIPKRYHQRNRELIERCDFVHAFVSKEGGYTGGTRFEIEYALKINLPVMVHWEKSVSEIVYQRPLSLQPKEPALSFAWQNFFGETLAL